MSTDRVIVWLAAMALLFRMPIAEAASTQADLLRQAENDFHSGRLEEAMAKCEMAIAQNPPSAYAYYLKGAIEERQGARETAQRSLAHALKIDSSLIPARILLGRIYLQSEKFDEAAVEFSLGMHAGDDVAKNAQYGMGLVLLERSQYEEALPFLTAASQAQPKDLARLYALISAELEQGLDTARTRRRQFDDVSPARPEISYKLGMLFLEHHMLRDAEAELRRVARMIEQEPKGALPPPNSSTLYLNLARLRFQRRDYWQALRDLAQVPHSDVSVQVEQEILLLAGQSLIAVGEQANGLEKLREAAQKDESNAIAQIRLVWAELLANHVNDARDLVRILEDKWPQAPEVGKVAALVTRESLPQRVKVPWSADWHLKGEGVVGCPCKVPCPCRSNGLPTETHCEATGAYRISEGHYGRVRLDDFVFVTVDANMGTFKAPLTLFVGPGASDEQLIALERIYQAFSPLQPLIFPTVVRGPISFRSPADLREFEVKIPGRLELKVARQLDEKALPLAQIAAVDPFANTIEYARNLVYKAWDESGNLQWDFSGRQGNLRFIDLDARDYTGGSMLAQFQDGAGFFNEEQLGLIGKLKLLLPAAPHSAVR